MITKEELARISKKSELNLYQQEKEYMLKIFLYVYYSKFEDAVFKGGTAIRFTENIRRFSEDLDFNISINPKEFQGQVEYALKEIRKSGVKIDFLKKEIFKDSFTCQMVFQGPLYDGAKQTRNKFQIDAGTRLKTLMEPVWRIIDSEYPETKGRFLAKVMDLREMLCEKIIALFERGKGRDLYDAWFLLNIGAELDKNLLKRKLKGRKIDKKSFTTEQEYNRDLKYLMLRVVPYEQVKREVLEVVKDIFYNGRHK